MTNQSIYIHRNKKIKCDAKYTGQSNFKVFCRIIIPFKNSVKGKNDSKSPNCKIKVAFFSIWWTSFVFKKVEISEGQTMWGAGGCTYVQK